MEGFAMREWLTIIIGVAILAVVLDGLRRMRQSNANSIRSSKKTSDENYQPQTFGSELPSGGARVVEQRDEQEAEKFNTIVKKAYADSKKTKGFRIPEQVALSLDETVPLLMDSVAEPRNPRTPAPQEPTLGNIVDIIEPEAEDEPTVSEIGPDTEETVQLASEIESAADIDAAASAPIINEREARQNVELEPQELDFEAPSDVIDDQEPSEQEPPEQDAFEQQAEEAQVPDTAGADPEEVFVINIMAPQGFYFAGKDLFELAAEAGLRLEEMAIFHRHHRMDGSGPILFSMANIVMPGTFDLQNMDDFKTPGVSLFLTLPCSARSMDAFDLLYGTADYLADNLGGDLKDEQRNQLTAQTIEHYRQRIRDYDRQSLMK